MTFLLPTARKLLNTLTAEKMLMKRNDKPKIRSCLDSSTVSPAEYFILNLDKIRCFKVQCTNVVK